MSFILEDIIFSTIFAKKSMTVFPCAKINLGLNVVSKRSDGYHDLQTVFHPIPLYDALEVQVMNEEFPSTTPCDLLVSGSTQLAACILSPLMITAPSCRGDPS